MSARSPLEVNDVGRNFGGLMALRNVSFAVREGEVMGLIGPNGAGKSTLFEIISGNLPPTHGHISYFGNDCTTMPSTSAAARRHVPHIPEGPAVREHDGRGKYSRRRLAMRSARAATCADEVAAILAQLRLEAQAQRRPSELTLADRKRVEIGRAIAGHCRLLMLDESMSGSDARGSGAPDRGGPRA